jgi:hypothetical protein
LIEGSTLHELNFFERHVGGVLGGKSTSLAKQRAARANGKHGGRPISEKKRTLLMHILRRDLTNAQHTNAQQAVARLSTLGGARSDLALFKIYFRLPHLVGYGFEIDLMTREYCTSPRKPSPRMKAILHQFRAWARFYVGA